MITGNIISNENSPETRTYNKARIRTIYKTNIKNRDMENETMDRRIEQKKGRLETGIQPQGSALLGRSPAACIHPVAHIQGQFVHIARRPRYNHYRRSHCRGIQ